MSEHIAVQRLENNICGFVALLRAMANAGVLHLVLSSSAAAHGESGTLPIRETAECRPSSRCAQACHAAVKDVG